MIFGIMDGYCGDERELEADERQLQELRKEEAENNDEEKL